MNRCILLAVLAIPAFAADYGIDDDHSFALFKVQHMGAGFVHGRFDAVTGDISFDEANPAASKVAITVKTDSISTGVPKMEGHLKSPEILDAVQFPTLSFTSKSWAKAADGSYDVSGDLSIHGVTKPVTVKAVKTGNGTNPWTKKAIIGFETTFDIKRADYGVTYGPGAIGDVISITFALEAIAK
jgi:polyisoprenoid-binding protein YceI